LIPAVDLHAAAEAFEAAQYHRTVTQRVPVEDLPAWLSIGWDLERFESAVVAVITWSGCGNPPQPRSLS
jgi:hypothetical protein